MSRVNFAVGGRCAVECCLQTIICLRSTRPLGVPVHACATRAPRAGLREADGFGPEYGRTRRRQDLEVPGA